MPQPSSSGATDRQAGAAAAGAAAGTTVGVAALGAGGAAAGAGSMVGAGAIMAALLGFLVSLREMRRRWLFQHLGRVKGARPDDIALVVADEMRREEAFAQASSDRLASALPQALAISDPVERMKRVRTLLEAEERYAQQRSEAMAARAIAALTRAQLRQDSPLGAYWRLGQAHTHTSGCVVMAGGDYEGAGRFWPWAVLDRVFPPRHYGCTSSLHGFGEAISQGWMSPGHVPDTRQAIRAAAGVMMEGEADALERELEVRELLVLEGAASVEALAVLPWHGIKAVGTAAGESKEEG